MLKVFFQNFTNKMKVSIHKPLDAVLEQVLEVFEFLPQHDGSYLGIISEQEITIQFTKYNKFVWLIEIPIPEKKGSYQMFLTDHKCKRIITSIFEGINPLEINGLIFEKKDTF